MITATFLAVSFLSPHGFGAESSFELVNSQSTTAQNTQDVQDKNQPETEKPPVKQPPNAEALAAQEKLDGLIGLIDDKAVRNGNSWQLSLAERQVFIVTDTTADRMRILTPIAPANDLSAALLERLLQANYDAALDARYAIAQEIVWSVFIHPLSSLTEKDFLSGAAQTVIAAQTFGTSFSSGMFVYGGGDTNDIHKELLEELEKRTQPTM